MDVRHTSDGSTSSGDSLPTSKGYRWAFAPSKLRCAGESSSRSALMPSFLTKLTMMGGKSPSSANSPCPHRLGQVGAPVFYPPSPTHAPW